MRAVKTVCGVVADAIIYSVLWIICYLVADLQESKKGNRDGGGR